MSGYQSRRSCRLALSVPVRVFGTDFRGRDFAEEAVTVVVNLHGAKIRMSHQLLPDAEIRLVSGTTGHDAVFRVVSKVECSELSFTYWGVESLEPPTNIWGIEFPTASDADQLQVQATLECPTCCARESQRVNETLLASIHERGGMERTCKSCQSAGFWKLLPFHSA